MLGAVIRQCRKAIEETIQQHGKAIPALECFPFKSLHILAEKIPFISTVNAKDGSCSLSRGKLPVYTAETHREWMLATFITLQNVIKDLLSMYRTKLFFDRSRFVKTQRGLTPSSQSRTTCPKFPSSRAV